MMDKAEHWFLNLVVERWFALEWLAAENLSRRIGQPGHGLSRAEIATVLYRLFQRGDIVAQHMTMRPPGVYGDDFVPPLTQIKSALAGELHMAYLLTPRGGARWESQARPDWSRYIVYNFAGFNNQAGEITGTTRETVRQYLSLVAQQMARVVTAGSEHWDTLVPWEATYWKVLPSAQRVRFRLTWTTMPPRLWKPQGLAWL
jgi:hypothetical protein